MVEWRLQLARFFFLWLYSPIQVLAASMELSVLFQLLDLEKSVGLLGGVISSSQGLYLYTNTKQNIHALGGIRTHDSGVCAIGDISYLRPLGYRDRH
jgi:hypothetical protein